MKTNWKMILIYTLQFLVGIALGYILFGCKSSKSGCDAYSQNKTKYENISRK